MHLPHWPKIPLWNVPNKVDHELILKLLYALGNPHEKLPPTIHVAGTNGKGSTVAMLKSIFTNANYKVHTYTSPHLLEFNERICLAGTDITDSHLYSILERTKEASDRLNLNPSFFEGITAAAFLAFAETDADIVLLETGMGGRLDCTNVIKKPLLTIITPISFDHTAYLGTDILQIAFEKAGIIKKNTPCVIGPQSDDVYNLLFNKCDEMESSSFCYEYDFYAEKTDSGFNYSSKQFNLALPAPNLIGDHQIYNAASVIASIMLINDKFKITSSQISEGLTSTNWPGRLQLVDALKAKELAGDNVDIYLDGAHNAAGAFCLSNWVRDNLNGDVYLILGMTRNRDILSFCNFFKDCITSGFAVNVESEPSSYGATALAQKATEAGIKFTASNSLQEAMSNIKQLHRKNPVTIIITGSLFLISDFLKL